MSVIITSQIQPFVSRWYPAIKKRRSRRQFDPTRPIEPELIAQLHKFCSEFKPFPSTRAVLIARLTDTVFKGIVGAYGKIKNSPAFIAFIGNAENSHIQEEVGYTGEALILEATALKLATCWVGGFFRPEVANSLAGIGKQETVIAVTPVGYATKVESLEERFMAGFGRNHHRLPLSKLTSGLKEDSWPHWIKASLEMARLAPSAVNRQPWGFRVDLGGITIFLRTSGPEFNVSKRLDCGIAMLHIELATLNQGLQGKWDFLEAPLVARFSIR